jgi:hypothetical protein
MILVYANKFTFINLQEHTHGYIGYMPTHMRKTVMATTENI